MICQQNTIEPSPEPPVAPCLVQVMFIIRTWQEQKDLVRCQQNTIDPNPAPTPAPAPAPWLGWRVIIIVLLVEMKGD